MKNSVYLIIVGLFTFVLLTYFMADVAPARPGGGHSYKKKKSSSRSRNSSRSSSHSSGNSSSYSNDDDDDEDDDDNDNSSGSEYVFDWENIDYEDEFAEIDSSNNDKVIAFLMAVVFFGSFIAFAVYDGKRNKRKILSTKPTVKNKRVRYKRNINNLSKLRKNDPNFSQTLFLDFASSLFAKYKSLLGKKEFLSLAPFVNAKDIEYSEAYLETISEVVIGSINVSKISIKNKVQTITVEIDANYTVLDGSAPAGNKNYRFAVVEKWQFSRKAGILSPEPEKMRELSCPVCGANTGFTSSGDCESCGTKIRNGEKQWYLSSHKTNVSERFSTEGLAYYAPERGTRLATIYQATLSKNTKKFAENHNLDWSDWSEKFDKSIVRYYFIKIYAGWSIKRLGRVRHLLSDRLYESWMFWIDNYTKEGLTNKLQNVRILKTEFVKLELDKFYESATMRITASCKDYVVDKSGKLVGGSKSKDRKFSEYWTFIRRAGIEKDNYDFKSCPNCGAPTDKIGQTGICEYCDTKISNGDFSWVLAVITQDEVYKG